MANDGQHSDPLRFKIENEMDLLFGRAHPNPAREGCPPRDLLVSLSRRELPIGDPAYDHLSKCSPNAWPLRRFRRFREVSIRCFRRPRRGTSLNRTGVRAPVALSMRATQERRTRSGW
jgi:hypothetical protein